MLVIQNSYQMAAILNTNEGPARVSLTKDFGILIDPGFVPNL